MKKAYLKWLIPVVVLYLMVGVACLVFGGYLKNEFLQTELFYMSEAYRSGINTADMIIKTAVDYNDSTAVCFTELDFVDDREYIQYLLSSIVQNNNVKISVACNMDGKGYDNKGNEISFTREDFFKEIKSTYSSGGKGIMPILSEGALAKDNIVVVNQVTYKDGRKGFLITAMDITDLNGIIFPYEEYYDKVALISLSGQIIAGKDVGSNFFDDEYGLQEDVIKLNISQKKDLVSRVEGHGYILMCPSSIASGAVIAIVSDEAMNAHPNIKAKMSRYYSFVIILMVCILIYTTLSYMVVFIESIIRKKLAAREKEKIKIDKITGLLNETAVVDEIKRFIHSPASGNGGLLYAVRAKSANPKDNERVAKALAKAVPQNYRHTDVLGRREEGEFLLFLKNIAEVKDIRKQTDELQMLLYDFKTELNEEDVKVKISVGRAIYPKDGSDAEQILDAAMKALEESRDETRENSSFQK